MALALAVAGGPGQIDDFRPGREPVLGASRVPQGVQPGVEDLGQRSRVRGAARQLECLVGQRTPPDRR